MNRSYKKIKEYIEFYTIIRDLINNKTVQEMKNYRQHYSTTTFEHCFYVSYISYKICKRLRFDYISCARAAFLHDLFLYNWRNSSKNLNLGGLHAFIHPKIALRNANEIFDLNKKEQDIILKHMWPVTLAFPKYKESFIVTFVDKYSAIFESLKYYHSLFVK